MSLTFIDICNYAARYIIFPTTILLILYLRLRWFSLSEMINWSKNSVIVTGTVLEMLVIKPESVLMLQNPLILKVSFHMNGEEIITYVDDKNLVFRNWHPGEWIVLRVLKDDPRQCHYKKYADDTPTPAFKLGYWLLSVIAVILWYMMYIVVMDSGHPMLAIWFLIPDIIFANVVIELSASLIEQYQNSFERIVNNLKWTGGF